MQSNDRNRIMETASATTSSDNANSGSFAYVITAVVLVLTLLLALAGGGCASLVVSAIADDYESEYGYGYEDYSSPFYDYYDQDLNDMDWDELLQHYEDEFGGNTNTTSQDAGSATVADVLDYDIAPYGSTIDDELYASSYAGTPTEVRDIVRTLVASDRSYTTQLVSLLNAAALNDDTRSKNIQDALALCEEAHDAIDELKIPPLSNDEGGSVRDALGSAKGMAAQRWSAMAEEIKMLDTTDEVDTARLWAADDEVREATSNAAEQLEDAMSAAAGN